MTVSGTTISRRVSEFSGVALFALALVWLIALATYDPADAVWFFHAGGQAPPHNFVGQVGALLAEASYQVVGFAAFLFPVIAIVAGWHYFWCRQVPAAGTKTAGIVLMLGSGAALMSLAVGDAGGTFRAGGMVGDGVARMLTEYFNRTGSAIVILTGVFLSVILATRFSFGRMLHDLYAAAPGRSQPSRGRAPGRQQDRHERRDRHDHRNRREAGGTAGVERPAPATVSATVPARAPRSRPPRAVPPPAKAAATKAAPQAARSSRRARTRPAPAAPPPALDLPLDPPVRKAPPAVARPVTRTVARKPEPPAAPPPPLPPDPALKARQPGSYATPPIALLDPPKSVQKIDERQLMDDARRLEARCAEFSVEGSIAQIHPGPVVTTFEFKPNAGVKYSKVTGLADDLCLAMRAESVLIERIPGKSTVGIQVPNAVRDQISLRELLETDVYRNSESKLTLVLGKTIHGEPIVSDLATMPHLLIAGSTGTGKSVSMNAMLTSILYRATPEDVRLILIDPKRLELGMYADIPHLLTPVVVDPKRAANALRWAVREMEERYKRLAAEGVRNIGQYNRNVARLAAEAPEGAAKAGENGEEPADVPQPLPYVVLAIDELADLMMVASKDVEECICRLAQMARAVGIHLILATQRPSVDVITGIIKANLPARISFRVSSKVDSRTILDANGAEQLLGKGDMLFLPPASSRCVRVHGPYISEKETARLASFLRKQGKPGYDTSITEDDGPADPVAQEHDDLYDQAARIVVTTQQASISNLQRRLKIGFSRAGRLVDMMEGDGLVSSGTAGKAREVLVKPDYFEEVDRQLR